MSAAENPARDTMLLKRLIYELRRLGSPAALGVILAICAASIEWSATDRLVEREAQLRGEFAALRDARAAAFAEGESRRLEGRISIDQLSDVVGEIHQEAADAGVQLERGDYRLLNGQSGTHARYQLSFPAQGRYKQLRQWLGRVTGKREGMSVENFDVKRGQVSTDLLEARITLSVLLRDK